jgi:hypothetical protein
LKYNHPYTRDICIDVDVEPNSSFCCCGEEGKKMEYQEVKRPEE